ncbi:MAG: TonB-dependent receptor [Chitinophagales bacterium]
MQKFIIIQLFFVLLPWGIRAQYDTTLLVPTVEIVDYKIREHASGSISKNWDSAQVQQKAYCNLGEFLQEESNVFIKTYGANSLATMSIRGSSASQSIILWNGLPIQSPMLGLLDLSLIPQNFSSSIDLELGANSSMWGSGAMGGVLSLNNTANYNRGLDLFYKSSLGSFSRLNQQISLAYGAKKFQVISHFVYQNAENDFKFRIDPSMAPQRQKHAAFKQLSALQSLFWKVNNRNEIAIHAWTQDVYRELPPNLYQKASTAVQEDNFYRLLGTWDGRYNKFDLQGKLAFFKENQIYEDPTYKTLNNNDFSALLAEFNYNSKFSIKHLFHFGTTQQFTQANTQAYESKKQQFRLALFSSYKLRYKTWNMQIAFRQELQDWNLVLPTASLAAEFSRSKSFLLRIKASRDYRLPTFNDLYWQPGGNENLKAENGWSEEFSWKFSKQISRSSLSLENAIYNRNIKDWILWVPSNNSFYWQSSNVAKVWSWGSELNFHYEYRIKEYAMAAWFNGSYTSSTYRINLDNPKISKGDQLLYTPIYQLKLGLKLRLKNLIVSYQHQVNSKSLGVNEDVPAYHLGNFHLEYLYQEQKWRGSLFLSVYNVGNKSYIAVERRPMPGINFQLGLNLYINHKNKKQ